MRFAAAILANDQLEARSTFTQVAAQILRFHRSKQRIHADGVGFKSARRRDAGFAEFAHDMLRLLLRKRHFAFSVLK